MSWKKTFAQNLDTFNMYKFGFTIQSKFDISNVNTIRQYRDYRNYKLDRGVRGLLFRGGHNLRA